MSYTKQQLHLYRCEGCDLNFGVDKEFENQVDVKCPVCAVDSSLVDYQQFAQYRILKRVQEEENVGLYVMFEQEFGRPLSPMEIQYLNQWQDEHDESLIKQALREAIISNVRNVRYIDKILFNWKRDGVSKRDNSARQGQVSGTVASNQATVPKEIIMFDWLET